MNRVVPLEAEAKLLDEQIKGIEENLLAKVATMKVVNRAGKRGRSAWVDWRCSCCWTPT